MADTMTSRGSIPEIVHNKAKLYQGGLAYYFRVVFHEAKNCAYPYHNFRHMFHVLWLCYSACEYYQDKLTPRKMRNLLIAVLFHDFDHSGMMGEDDLNIERAVRALRRYIADEDKDEFEDIAEMIRATEYPFHTPSEGLPLCSQIIRDADLSQALSSAWIQQVIFGLAAEWRIKPIEVLRRQADFLRSINFCTQWARELFPQSELDEQIAESEALLRLLEDYEAS